MAQSIQMGTILIKDDTFLPDAVRIETESCVPGWRLVKDLDKAGLDRTIRGAGWNFFCVAGETRTTVFGIDGGKMIRKAIERILSRLSSEKFNCLEIVGVAYVASERFLGVRNATVSAQSRHIQEGFFLDLPLRETTKPSKEVPNPLIP
jgi:hypothetical protein